MEFFSLIFSNGNDTARIYWNSLHIMEQAQGSLYCISSQHPRKALLLLPPNWDYQVWETYSSLMLTPLKEAMTHSQARSLKALFWTTEALLPRLASIVQAFTEPHGTYWLFVKSRHFVINIHTFGICQYVKILNYKNIQNTVLTSKE